MGSDEKILVVPRRMLIQKPFRGFTRAGVEDYLLRVREYGVFRPRAGVEEDPSFKQIIPYLLVRHRGRLFLVQRSTEGGETRLHGKYSIGVGGHINRGGVEGAQDVLDAGMKREMEEELLVRGTWQARPGGVLKDASNPVGQGRFGLVQVGAGDSAD